MAHLDHLNRACRVINEVNDAIVPLTNSEVSFDSGKLFAANWAWLKRKSADLEDNALAISLAANCFDFLRGGGLDQQPISGHAALGHARTTQR